MDHSKIDHLFVIGGGVLENRNGQFFVKAAIGLYLEQLSSYLPKLTFVAANSASQIYSTPLDTGKIRTIQWNFRTNARSYISLLKQIELLSSHIGVLLYVPQTQLLPLIPFFRFFSRRFIVYVAGDWIEINEELRKRGKAWRVPLDNAAAVLPIRWADSVLVRGPKLLRQAKRYNPNVVESLPIVAWQQSLTQRNDTCRNEQINLLYVGKLVKSKGLGVLSKALAYLRKARPELGRRLQLYVLGSGIDEGSLKNHVNILGLGDIVHFKGYVDDPDKLGRAYQEADILIMPSANSEGLPRVIDEGFIHSLPVIATRTGGIPIAYADREEIMLVPRGDVSALAQAIQEIVQNEDLRRRLIQNGNKRTQALRAGYTAARQHAELILGRRLPPVTPAQNGLLENMR